jgi:MFS family permease
VQDLIWQWIFWINVPIAAVLIPFVLVRLEENAGSPRGLDYAGIGLVSAAAFGFVWGLIRGNESGWASAEVVAALSGGAIALVVFVGWELRADAPLIRTAARSDGHRIVAGTVDSGTFRGRAGRG